MEEREAGNAGRCVSSASALTALVAKIEWLQACKSGSSACRTLRRTQNPISLASTWVEERAGERRCPSKNILRRGEESVEPKHGGSNFYTMNPTGNARRLRRQQTKEERELWQALRAGRFAGFKWRRQHPLGGYYLDFYCADARLVVELDGFQHGMPEQRMRDEKREAFLNDQGIKVRRFWNHQWRQNRDGVLLEIWNALHERTGCVQIMRKLGNNRFVPPDPNSLK